MLQLLDEKTRKTLKVLGVQNAGAVKKLFAEVRAQLESERAKFLKKPFAGSAELEVSLKELRDRWHSRKKGLIAAMDEHWLKPAAKEIKPAVGRSFNELRKATAAIDMKELRKDLSKLPPVIEKPPPAGAGTDVGQPHVVVTDHIDPTLPGRKRHLGSLHPITRVQREIEDIFLGLGFQIETGPEVESAYYNFDALNIPETHPSRDDQDTLYVDAKTVLRTHTSPVQIRAMERYKEPPIHIIIPGKCYRRDNPDATHSPMFHQIEGLAIDRDITFADLKGVLNYFGKRFFGETVQTSFHPSFFPFTEPSAEVAISCTFCDGAGCRVCKEGGWIEVMGCGMVHPEVLRHGGVDPNEYSGWAFGLGVERFAMLKYGINEIQLFFQDDVRFLEQFP